MAGRPGRRGGPGGQGQGRHPRHHPGLGQEHLFRRRRPQGRDAHAARGRQARLRRDRAHQEELPHHRDPRQAGGELPERHRAGRRLGGGAGGPSPHRGEQPQDAVRPARGHPGPDPRRRRHHQDDAPARPDGRAALPAGEQAVRPGRGAEAGLRARAGRQRRRADARRARLDRFGAGQCRGLPAPLGPQGLQDARRHAEQPGHRAGPGGGARHAQEDHARPVPGARGRAVRDGRRRAGRLRHRDAHREPLPGRPDGQPGGEEHDQHVLLQPERHQVGPEPPEGRAALQAQEGRHPGRRHDGRGHRLLAGQPRHRLGAEGREPGKGRARQGLQRQAHPGARGQGPHGPARPGRAAGPHHAHRQRRRPARAAT
jgi:hypothetical protein